VLLIGAGLMVKGVQGLLSVNEKLRSANAADAYFALPEVQYAQPAARLNFNEQILRRLSSVSGVQAPRWWTYVPYTQGGGVSEREFSIEGRPPTQRGEVRSAIVETTTPNYFNTMNIALRDGRLLSDTDGAESPHVRSNQRKPGQALFPGRKSAGRHIRPARREMKANG